MSHEMLILRFCEADVLSEHKKQGKVLCKNKTHFHLPMQDIDMKTELLRVLTSQENFAWSPASRKNILNFENPIEKN